MTAAFAKFRQRLTHAQLIETKHGGWKKYMNEDDKRFYRAGIIIKGSAIVGAGIILALTTVPVLAAGGIAGGIVLPLLAYGYGAYAQAFEKSSVEQDLKNPHNKYAPVKKITLLKNTARYLFQPF